MTELRNYVSTLSNKELWELFDEFENFEKNSHLGNSENLRILAVRFGPINMLMATSHTVGFEVCRELAQRGAAMTITE